MHRSSPYQSIFLCMLLVADMHAGLRNSWEPRLPILESSRIYLLSGASYARLRYMHIMRLARLQAERLHACSLEATSDSVVGRNDGPAPVHRR